MAFLDKTGLERLWLHILSKTNQTLASAKQYADDIKNDLLNGAGGAYDTLKELGDLIDENADAIGAIERLADTKSDKGHIHDDRYYTETEVDDALKFVKEASGEVITVNDSAEQNLVGLKLYGKTTQTTTTGKNLLDIASIVPPSTTYNGITITSLGNGFTVKGTATGNAAFKWALTTPIPAGTYWLHAWNIGFNAACTLYFEKPGTVDVGHTPLSSNYRKQKIASDGDLVYLKLYIPSGQTVDMHLCPMLTVEETDTYEPYTGGAPSPSPNYPQPLVSPGDSGSIGVRAMGKNLLPEFVSGYWDVATGAAVDDTGQWVRSPHLIPCNPGNTYTLNKSDGTAPTFSGYIVLFDSDKKGTRYFNTPTTFTIAENERYIGIYMSYTTYAENKPLQLALSPFSSSFEPYKDGGSLTASTPNGLPGIPVTSSGNYVDTQGQMWLCDEIDFEHGVRKPKVRKIVFDGSPDENWVGPTLLGNLPNLVTYHVLDYVVSRPLLMCDRFQTLPNVSGQPDGTICVGLEGVDFTHGGVFFGVRGIAATNEDWRAWLAEHPVTILIMAPDDEPEVPIPPAELTAYRAMMSQYPNTTVYNDAGAGMTVEYADIKIDDIEKALNLPEIDSTLTLSNAAAEAKATGTALAGKVDKVAGKGLSTNDFTTAEKEKLSRLSETGNIEVDSELSDNSENPVQNKVINDALKFLKKSDGDIVTITDGAAHPAIELISHIEPLQVGSGEPSPTNVRAISGWDAASITRTGKNLFGGDVLADKLVSVINGIKDTAAETITFYAPNATGQKLLTGIFKPNTQYTFVFYGRNDSPDSPLNLRIHYSDGTTRAPVFSERNKDEQIVIYSEYGKTIEDIRCVYWDGSTTLYYNKCGVFEGIIEAAQFEPYNGTTLTATLPQTIYGGTLNWTTGAVQSRAVYLPLKNLTGTWFLQPDVSNDKTLLFSYTLSNASNEDRVKAVCSHFANYGTNPQSETTRECIGFHPLAAYKNYFYIRINRDRLSSQNADGLKTWLTENNVALCYYTDNATEYQLTPQQLSTIKGTNNVWSDCGETELTYATIRTDEIEKVLIDPTLSIKGTAAEAQTVGKELQHLQKETQFLDEAKGDIIIVNNSAELPLNNLKLYGKTTQLTTTGKNLLPNTLVSTTKDGITFTANDDGSITLNGTAGVDAMVRIYTYTNEITGLDVVVTGGINSKVQMIITDNVHADLGVTEEGAGARFVGYDNAIVYIGVVSGASCDNVTVYPMIRVSSNTDTTYEPYTGGIPSPNPDYPQELVSVGDDGSIGVKTMGKNLLPINSINTSQNDAGLIELAYLPAGTYTLSADITKYADDTATNTRMSCSIIYTDGQTEGFSTDFDVNKAENDGITRRKQRSFLIRADKKVQRIVIYALDYSVPGSGRNAKAENIQIECGPTATAFEPYKDSGTLAISTPNGLPGIKVISEGNYTDSDGQQWICDEKDYGRGVYVQRVMKLTIDGSADELIRKNTTDSNDWLHYIELPYAKQNFSRGYCDKLQEQGIYMLQQYGGIGYLLNTEYCVCYINMSSYMEDNSVAALRNVLAANPITIIYILKTPIETPLSAAELAAYRAMTTQNPTTVIYNDVAADMYVSYGTYKAGEMEEALGIPKVDKTLSLEGAPADAKTVGDILNNQYSVKRETGDIISVDTIEGLAIHPTTYIEPLQAGSGDPSPSNVRPITGWDSVTVQRTGKNIMPGGGDEQTGQYINYAVSGAFEGLEGREISVSFELYSPDGSAVSIYAYQDSGLSIDTGLDILPGAGSYVRYSFNTRIKRWEQTLNDGIIIFYSPSGAANKVKNVQIELGTVATDYEPYQGQTLSATLPETVYGGKLDWATGVLTVTHKIVDISTLVWHYDSDVGGFFTTYLAGEIGSNNKGFLVCSAYIAGDEGNWWTTNNSVSFNWDGRVLIRDTRFSDAADFVAALSGVMLVYPLAAHRTIQLTPQQLSTIEGQNNIWSNAGKTEALINLTPINALENISSTIDSKLDKTTYEYNKELALGYSGKVCIGKFPAYDSNISVEIKSTTDIAYNGTLIIATQNINTTGGGGYSATVYGDATNTLANSIKIHYGSGSNVFSVYIDLPSWSKNLLHIQCVSLAGTPTDIATIVSSIPEEATIVPVNALQATYSTATSLINGSTFPSVRMISATAESDDYKLGLCAFAEGASTKASGDYSHAEGAGTTASGKYSHAEGTGNTAASGDGSHAEGQNTTAKGDNSHAEGYGTTAVGDYSHAEGYNTKANTSSSHAEGESTTASGWSGAHAEGRSTTASGQAAHAEGQNTTAKGDNSHAEGYGTTAAGVKSHAEGYGTVANGEQSHVEGQNTEVTSSGNNGHAEGYNTTVSAFAAHAEGNGVTASGYSSHAEGYKTTASGTYSHAEGSSTTASNTTSHAEGCFTTASGVYSHTEGYETIASCAYQHVQGKYNIEDLSDKYAHIIGNGESDTTRSNAHTLDWNGNAWFKGSIYVGGTGQTDTAAVMVLPAKLVSTTTTPTTNNTIYWLYE